MALKQSSFTSCFSKITHILQINFVEFLLAWQCHCGIQCKRMINETENYIYSCRMDPLISMRMLCIECKTQCMEKLYYFSIQQYETIELYLPKPMVVHVTYPKEHSLQTWRFRSYFSTLILLISSKWRFKTVLATICIITKEGEEKQTRTLSLLNLSPYPRSLSILVLVKSQSVVGRQNHPVRQPASPLNH